MGVCLLTKREGQKERGGSALRGRLLSVVEVTRSNSLLKVSAVPAFETGKALVGRNVGLDNAKTRKNIGGKLSRRMTLPPFSQSK